MEFNEAVKLAQDYIPQQYELEKGTDMGDAYWFSYKRPDGAPVIGAALVAVDKSTGNVKSKSFTEDIPNIRHKWNEATKIKVA